MISILEMRGERVCLRDWRPEDVDEDLRALLDPARPWHLTNGPYFGRPTVADMERLAAHFARLAATEPDLLPEPRENLPIIVEDAVVGSVSWRWEDERTDWRRMGVTVYDETQWGQGIATEAMALWTTYLFEVTDALRLDFASYSGNTGMMGVGRKLGFVEEARMRKARRWSGGVHDAIIMGILREEWDQAQGDTA